MEQTYIKISFSTQNFSFEYQFNYFSMFYFFNHWKKSYKKWKFDSFSEDDGWKKAITFEAMRLRSATKI